MRTIKIIIALAFLTGFAVNVRIVESGAGQIVSAEKIAIDPAEGGVKEIKMVTPDEVQRLEDSRDREIELIKRDIALLKNKVAKLESQNNQ